MSEITVDNGRDEKGRFGPGNSGRPKGSRAKLGEAFIAAIQADFEEGGIEAIRRVRIEDPSVYLTVISRVLPKELDVSGTVTLEALILQSMKPLSAPDDTRLERDEKIVCIDAECL